MPPSFLKRTIAIAVVAVVLWAAFFIAWPLVSGHATTLFGLPPHAALPFPVILPAFVLIMFWFARRQNTEDERFEDDG